MLNDQRLKTLAAADCEVAFDNLTRQLYATDASHYQVVPLAVAFPRDAQQAGSVIRAAAEAGVSVTPRGAGTGLTGGAIGNGLVVDFARHNRQIHSLDPDYPRVRVGAGAVLDALNAFLKPHGLAFGPDVATSSRATLGGMIANNSSGARVPVYGVTADHVISLEVVMADGTVVELGTQPNGPPTLRCAMEKLIAAHAAEIRNRMPPGLLKRWPGYGLDRFLWRRASLTELVAGSEGTLAGIWSAELKAVPLPRETGLGLVFFASVAEAMQATVELLDLKPAAIEHLDRMLLDQTRGQGAFKAARDLLELDAKPCESVLIVQFFDEVTDRMAALTNRALGLRKRIVTSPSEMDLVWNLRKAGLSLLQSCRGGAKPVEGIEDAAVRPQQLPDYVAGLEPILKRLGLRASFYGHAASGLLHVRPVLDLHDPGAVRKYRQAASEVSALVRHFKGSLAAEHGLGMARTEFLEEHIGAELVGVMRQIKRAFDPNNVLNPGKIVGDGRYYIDQSLRWTPGVELQLPFEPALAFAARDGSFLANLEQCNGCGGCRKDTPTMCPTFIATGEEFMSTRGRANAIRAALELRGLEGSDALRSAEMDAALSNCLSCKACTDECPSNVNLALLKAELLYARHRRDGVGLRTWLVSHVDRLGRLGCFASNLANHALAWPWARHFAAKTLGLTVKRPLPAYASERFDRWFANRKGAGQGIRGKIILWDDTFVRYHEPHIGVAAVRVLEAAGFEVVLPLGRKCCGRPAFSQGNLELVKAWGRHNLDTLVAAEVRRLNSTRNAKSEPPNVGCYANGRDVPILFLEPSCWSMFVEDYRELRLPGAEQVAERCHLFEEFVANLLSQEPEALKFGSKKERVAIHAHCHAKALRAPGFMVTLAKRLPEREVTLLNTGCCGMAGAFGALEAKYELSLKVAEPLAELVRAQGPDAVILASGTSCRQQIQHVTPARPKHMAELLADALG